MRCAACRRMLTNPVSKRQSLKFDWRNQLKTIPIETLRSEMIYDPDTGFFVYRSYENKTIKPGRNSGTTDKDGYVCIRVRGLRIKAHRAAWAITYGSWPSGQIDHINGVKSDNRISNLRVASSRQNNQNRIRALPSSKSGLIGAMSDNSTGRFRARIRVDGRRISLGSFATAEEASFAYVSAKRILHEFCSI